MDSTQARLIADLEDNENDSGEEFEGDQEADLESDGDVEGELELEEEDDVQAEQQLAALHWRAANKSMMICVSSCRSGCLVLDA